MTHNMTPAADPLAQWVDSWRWGPELSGYLGLSQPASGPTWEKLLHPFSTAVGTVGVGEGELKFHASSRGRLATNAQSLSAL